jgi:hypothetical protein
MPKTPQRAPPTRLVVGVRPEPLTPAAVRARFFGWLGAGARLRPAGRAGRNPARLLAPSYLPRHAVRLFDATYLLADYRHDDWVGYFVGYVALGAPGARVCDLWPRVFYKDSSLLWRVASHFAEHADSRWIGKGDTRVEEQGEWILRHSAEETANLPYELQLAFDELSRRGTNRRDDHGIPLVVREAPPRRIEAYADFCAPRRAAERRHGREHGGRPVARFRRAGDPSSLEFARGYEPDFARGVLERGVSSSAFFGGRIEKVRILARNRRVQYLFLASPTHAWLGPPQLLTTELSSFGVRTLDVAADEDAFLPGFEYHEEGASQIPAGFAGAPHPENPDRADAAAWLEALPVIREFRARVLRRAAPRRPSTR